MPLRRCKSEPLQDDEDFDPQCSQLRHFHSQQRKVSFLIHFRRDFPMKCQGMGLFPLLLGAWSLMLRSSGSALSLGRVVLMKTGGEGLPCLSFESFWSGLAVTPSSPSLAEQLCSLTSVFWTVGGLQKCQLSSFCRGTAPLVSAPGWTKNF